MAANLVEFSSTSSVVSEYPLVLYRLTRAGVGAFFSRGEYAGKKLAVRLYVCTNEAARVDLRQR